MKRVVVKSYAKINIALNVISKREDGFHELDMVMLPLKLHDSLLIEELPNVRKDNFIVMDDFSYYVGHNNIANAAINALDQKVNLQGKKFKVTIHKNIPMQGGMGGGSSNAAATMIGIDKLLKLNLSREDFLELAPPLGSDVAFFIDNKPARCRGKGEVLTPISVKNNYYVLIIKPNGGCSTKAVYTKFDENPEYSVCDIDKVVKALEEGDDDTLANVMGNSLQNTSISIVPEIKTIIDNLKADGLKIVAMTGSGSTVFALSTNLKQIKRIAKKYENSYRVEITEVLK